MKQRLISIPFFLLRTTTAGAALVTGLLQTYVFAHVLSPQRFSIFILVAAFGYSLWLIDFGIVKILFVRLRARFLAGDHSDSVAGHATRRRAVLFRAGERRRPALLSFSWRAARRASLREAAEFGLFFWFVALNLVWFALRNICHRGRRIRAVRGAGDRAPRRLFHRPCRGLVRLPLLVMLIALNALWAVVVTVCVRRMIARGALQAAYRRLCRRFRLVLPRQQSPTHPQRNLCGERNLHRQLPLSDRADAVRPGRAADHPRHHLQGVPRRRHHFGAVCDILVPRQTSALAERDGPTLVRATLMAAALCSIPAAIACIILIFGADRLFAFLLGNAATMPPATTPILIVLLIANLAQMVANSVLVHNGYFREVARIGMGVVAAMTGVGAVAILAHLDIVQFLEAYVAVYCLRRQSRRWC